MRCGMEISKAGMSKYIGYWHRRPNQVYIIQNIKYPGIIPIIRPYVKSHNFIKIETKTTEKINWQDLRKSVLFLDN